MGSGNMLSPLPTAFLVIIHGLAVGGFTSNAFIVAVTVIEWARSRSLNSSEQLLLSLSISNICCTTSGMVAVYREHFNFMNFIMSQVVNIFLSISTLSRFWFTGWLCVFYCVKIVNSTHCFFLWCKQTILRLLPWILVVSVAISIPISIFAYKLDPAQLQSNTTTINITEKAQNLDEDKPRFIYKILFYVIGTSFPLLVVSLCSIVTAAFLFIHVCQIRGTESSFRSPQTEVHFKAARTVLFLLFLYLSFFSVQMVPSITDTGDKKVLFCVYCVVFLGYSLAQAVILVLVNTRLKQTLNRMLPGRKP